MSEHHRALVVVVFVGLIVSLLANRLRGEELPGAHTLRRNLWFALTVTAFALGNFWYFSIVAAAVLLWAGGRERNVPALFLALLFVVPPTEQEIPGMGFINLLFSLSYPRLLVLTLLLPAFVRLVQKPRRPAQGLARLADLLFAGYLLVQLLLLGREPSITAALRGGFYLAVDLFLPYYVFSRALDDVAKVRDAVAALVIAGMLLAGLGMFEAARNWLLYYALVDSWGAPDGLAYLDRGGVLRAMGSAGHAIALGYVMAICLLLYLPMRARLRGRWQAPALLLLLLGGLLAPLSRGPWLGAAAGLLLYILLGPRAVRNVLLLGVAGLCGLAVLPFVPGGHFLLGLIPFFGNVETGNIEYRQRLMESASELIWANPILGSVDYVERLAAMGMVQGQGIVDIVNAYVQVALRSGLVGLSLFGGFMLAVFFSVLRARKAARRALQPETAELGRSLVSAQLVVIVTIASVSSIFVIPWIYWCLAGTMVAYARLAQEAVRQPQHAAKELRPA